MKHDTYLFDLAGVILNLNLTRDAAALSAVGLPDFQGCLANPAIRRPMEAYLNGLTTKAEYLRDIRPVCREGVSDSELLWAMDAVLDDVPAPRLAMLRELRREHRVYLLSNIYDTAWQHAVMQIERAGYAVGDCFDRVFLSFEMRLAKPDPRIFRAVIAATGLNPATTLYLDDTAENIVVGQAMGFRTCRVPLNRLEDVLPAHLAL